MAAASTKLRRSAKIFGDFFERYPNIKMVHSMLGGAYFAFKEMLLPHGPKRPDASGRFQVDTETVSRRLENNIYFDMSHAQPWGKIHPYLRG